VKAKARFAARFGRSGASRSWSSRVFATRASAGDGKGSGAQVFRLGRVAVAVVLTLVVTLLVAGNASADTRIPATFSNPPLFAQAGAMDYNLSAIAVSEKESGDVYFPNSSSLQRVNEIEPDGTWVRAFGFGVVPGAATGIGDLTAGSTLVTNVTTTTGSFNEAGLPGKILSADGIPVGTTIIAVRATELELSKPATGTALGTTLTVAAGPGNTPVNEQQDLQVGASSGEFKLRFISPKPGSSTTETNALSYNATASQVLSALEGLANIGAGNVSVTGGPGNATGSSPYTVTFEGKYADTNVRKLSTTNVNLSGGSPSTSLSVTTPTEGGGIAEACTTICGFPSAEENVIETGEGFGNSRPGNFNYSDEIAVDNDSASESYGDVYVLDQRNYRVQKFSGEGQFLLMFGGAINTTKVQEREEEEANSEPVTVTEDEENVCTAADLIGGDQCGAGVPGTGPSHFYKGSYPREWEQTGNNSIAIGPGGKVYVGDYGRVQEFNTDGTFAGELALPDPEKQFVTGLAVDSSGNIFERSTVSNGNSPWYAPPVSEIHGIREYNAAHTLVRTIDTESGSEPFALAVDQTGALLVADRNGGAGHFQFRGFKPNGALASVFTSDQIENGRVEHIAIGDSERKLYATTGEFDGGYIAVIPLPVEGPPAATKPEATNVQPTTATLHALVNPHGFDTKYHFEYVDQHSFETEGGFGSPNTQSTPSHDLGIVDQENAVQVAISGLTPETQYQFRVVAESSEGTVYGTDEFASLPPVSVRNFTTQTVGPELVTLKAELNPNGQFSSYTIHIGKDTTYSTGSSQGTLAVGNEFVDTEITLPNLQPNTTYHYQFVGENGYGETKTLDQTFTTERSAGEERAAEDCPNTNLREENNSLGLPDCRAYEQVSAVHKEGGQAFPLIYFAPGGERAIYVVNGDLAGAAANEIAIYYLAQRSESGWSTTAPIRRLANTDYQPGSGDSLNLSAELDRWTYTQRHGLNFEHQDSSSVFLSMGFVDGAFVPQATPTFSEPEGGSVSVPVRGQSQDLSTEFILTSQRLLESDPRPSDNWSWASRIYEMTDVGGSNPTLKLIAETPLGLHDESCQLSNFVNGPGGNTGGQGVAMSSSDASTVVYTAPVEVIAGQPCGKEGKTANQFGLYARVNGAAPIQINQPLPSSCHSPSPCASSSLISPLYDGISQDGTRIWFETPQPLVDSDNDDSNDVYMARLANGEVAELVQASAGEATPSHPTPGKDAEVGEEGVNGYPNHGVARVSRDGTRVAYESMHVLTTDENALQQSAVKGANNLYIYDVLSNQTKFVTELCSGIEFSGSDRANRSGPGSYYEVSDKNAVHDGDCPRKSVANFENLIGYGGPCGNNDAQMWIYDCNGGQALFSDNGRYFFFTSWGRLTPDDTDDVKDLYRFDVQTGDLIRLSVGRNGNDANGNSDEFPIVFQHGIGGQKAFSQAGDEERNISSDGSVAIFRTAAPLVSHDTNASADPTCSEGVQGTGCDVYMWEEQGHGTCVDVGGCVSLVSDGLDPHGVPNAVLSASGRDITFQTQRNLIPADTDGVGDIYDARINGGFHTPHPPSECGSPEACRAAHEPEPAAPAFSTENFVSGGNGASLLQCAKGRVRRKRHGQLRCVPKHHGKRHKKKQSKRVHHRNVGPSTGGGR
jgi:hypothetical protein